MKHELLIIGAGASGLLAAITAKDMGIDVALIEGTDRIGKKILTTGNGRCNITNKNINLHRYHSENPNYPTYILNSFTTDDTINFFSSIGLPIITLEDGKMYPMSLQASSVLDIFRLALRDKNIPLYLGSKIKKVQKTKTGFKLISNTEEIYQCNKLILAAGGKSYSKTGSDGSGFLLAEKLGHKIITTLPSLVQLKLNYKKLKALSGVKFNGYAEIFVDDDSVKKEFGEILFTDYGISGPPILQLSRIASYYLKKSKKVSLTVDMMPHMNINKLKDFIENHWGMFGYRSVSEAFIGIINKKIIPILLKEAGVADIHKPCWNLDWKEKDNILKLLKSWYFEVNGTNPFSSAQITAGGIDVSQVNPKTLESKLVPNLYFCGEILDVDGDCGGFNLQWAWSSGFVAAKNACGSK